MKPSKVYVVCAAALSGVALALAALFLYRRSSRDNTTDDDNGEFQRRKKTNKNNVPGHARDKKEQQRPSGSRSPANANTQDNNVSSTNTPPTTIPENNCNGQQQLQQPGEDSNQLPTPDDSFDMFTADGFTTLKLTVPKDMVGAIIGRQGCNIKQIQAETNTKIDFSKQTSEGTDRTITIRGSEKGAQDAELRILHIIYGRQAKQTTTMQVPQGSLGYIIGRGGENIQKMQSDSRCQIKVGSSSSDRSNPMAMVDVKLTGSDGEIASAMAMVDEYVQDWESKKNRAKLAKDQARPRQPGSRRAGPSAILPGSPLVTETWPNHSDYVDCYVTATVDPTHIWLQLLMPSGCRLEEINSQLSKLYSDADQYIDDLVANRPPIGTIVAARNPSDNLWFRGKITAYKDEKQPSVDIYYVDYGDSSWTPLENYNIQLLRPEFYGLPAQAIECFTDIILHPECPTKWKNHDCDRFEKLTHTGNWSVLVGAVVSWRAKEDTGEELPVIKLADTNTDVDIYIADEIIRYIKSEKVGLGSFHIHMARLEELERKPPSCRVNLAEARGSSSSSPNSTSASGAAAESPASSDGPSGTSTVDTLSSTSASGAPATLPTSSNSSSVRSTADILPSSPAAAASTASPITSNRPSPSAAGDAQPSAGPASSNFVEQDRLGPQPVDESDSDDDWD